MTVSRRLALLMTAAALLTACGESSKLPPQASVGPSPQLPEPTTSLIPTLKVSKAVGWSGSDMPKAPAGFKVTALADDLDHPRWIYL
ncbi:MAG: sorbosone dehydrogenase family protein, partial [Pseudomonas sp.]|nr:sorbosone dehydrogenase family protein [Pseudomonas sp.]